MSLPVDFPHVVTGDPTPSFESFRFSEITDENSDRGRLHYDGVLDGGLLRCDVYQDRGKGSLDLILQGSGAKGATITLTPQNDSGAAGTVVVREVIATSGVVYVALASDLDLIERDDRIRGLLLEEPPEQDFRLIWRDTLREFYERMQAEYPPPVFSGDPLAWPGAAPVQEQGSRGMPDVMSIEMWHLNDEGDWELRGLENPGDYRQWAILYGLFLIWDRNVRGGNDESAAARADRYMFLEQRKWKQLMPRVDVDRDSVPERPIRKRTGYMTRG